MHNFTSIFTGYNLGLLTKRQIQEVEKLMHFCDSFDGFAFAGQQLPQLGIELESLIRYRKHQEAIQAIVSPEEIGYGQIPKGLLGFDFYRGSPRSAFDEHLIEAVACLGTCRGDIKAHLAMSADSQAGFIAQL